MFDVIPTTKVAGVVPTAAVAIVEFSPPDGGEQQWTAVAWPSGITSDRAKRLARTLIEGLDLDRASLTLDEVRSAIIAMSTAERLSLASLTSLAEGPLPTDLDDYRGPTQIIHRTEGGIVTLSPDAPPSWEFPSTA